MNILSQPYLIPSSRLFIYPTRLISAWQPQIMEVCLPEYTKKPLSIEINIQQASTQSSIFEGRNIYRRIYKQFSPSLSMENKYLYDVRHNTDRNIAHLISEIAKVLLVQKLYPELPKITLIFREKVSEMAKKICQTLDFSFIATDQEVYGNLVTVVEEDEGSCESYFPELFGNLSFDGYTQETPEKVFIARRGQRALINEDEVCKTLQAYGFVKFYYEDLSIGEQWSISKNAKAIVALHGAALASLVFNNRKVKLLEFFHPGYVVNMYRHYAAIVGGRWCGVVGKILPEVVQGLDIQEKPRKFALSNTVIDLSCLRMAIEYLDIN